MGVTGLLLLGPFYYITGEFSILFCTRLYQSLKSLNVFKKKLRALESKICLTDQQMSAKIQFLSLLQMT